MEYVLGALAFVFILGTIIALHEGGHFFFARRAGILCREYAFGMGPILWKKKKGETLYSIRAFPIGGFCAIAGETEEEDPFKDTEYLKIKIENNKITDFYIDVDDDNIEYPSYQIGTYDIFDSEDKGYLYMNLLIDGQMVEYEVDSKALVHFKKQDVQIAPHNRTLNAKNKRQRAMTIFGGPLMNFLLALVAFFISGLIMGFADTSTSQVASLTDGSQIYQAGLRDDDIITALEVENVPGSYQEVSVWNDISTFMSNYYNDGTDEKIIITYDRDGEKLTTNPFYPTYYIYNMNMVSDPTTKSVKIGNIAKDSSKMMSNIALDIGDEILSIDGVKVTSWNEAAKLFAANTEGNMMNLEIKTSKGDEIEVEVMPFSKEIMDTQSTSDGEVIPSIKVAMGVSPRYAFNLWKSFGYSGRMTLKSCTMIFQTFGLLFGSSKVGITELSGPVGIFSLLVQVVQQGWASVFYWMGLLSVNVGLLNLLPIPALDGGRLVFIGYEAVTKRKPSEKVQTILITVTMILLFALMIFVFINDIIGLFR